MYLLPTLGLYQWTCDVHANTCHGTFNEPMCEWHLASTTTRLGLLVCFEGFQPVQYILQHIVPVEQSPEHGVYSLIPYMLAFLAVYLTE